MWVSGRKRGVLEVTQILNTVSLTQVQVTGGKDLVLGLREHDLGFNFEHVEFEASYWIYDIYLVGKWLGNSEERWIKKCSFGSWWSIGGG